MCLTSNIHKVKCYIVVIQEIGNIFLRSKPVIETPIKDFCQLILVCMYSRLLNNIYWWKNPCLANTVLVSGFMSSNSRMKSIKHCVVSFEIQIVVAS